ncbi:hypothetical protein [Curtobacterium flaccumfaciens]|uniref:hypothetical protein n=1 Tax=Curtobacterium flaccumfaciens TaxID=2035 RepID=UPI001BDF9452|nr:hypothetical protein [Curtobacterium flaccumfaciens]MBT1582578.1 hypothetical protein [Curtobacterium flaccumfaciens pv. flaccumfaciens]MCX2796820.1 hypothetical protein [Curtobacterium flaccumfaciens pv. flaccumfaciens]
MSTDETSRWDDLPHRTPSDDEAQEAMDRIPDGDPMHVALAFVYGLSELNAPLLEMFTNPESRDSWGDYQEAHDLLESFGEWGIGSEAQHGLERGLKVAYVKILPEVAENMQVTEDTPVMAAAVLSLIRRPDINGGWFVQAIGDYWHAPAADETS